MERKWLLVLLLPSCFLSAFAYKRRSGYEQPPEISTGSWSDNDIHGEWHQNSTPPLDESPYSNSILIPASVRGITLICNASYPIEWKFHKEMWGRRQSYQYGIQSTRFSDGLDVVGFSAEMSILGFGASVSGNYTCQKVGNPGISTSLYIFWEGNTPPYLTLAKTFRKPETIPYQMTSGSFVLPCSVAVPTVVPTLYKTVNDKDVVIQTNQSITYDPRVGFTMVNLKFPYGKYKCQAGDPEEGTEDDGDIIMFEVVDADGTKLIN